MAKRQPCGENGPFPIRHRYRQSLLASRCDQQCQKYQKKRTNGPIITPQLGVELRKLFCYQGHSSGYFGHAVKQL